MDSVSKDTTSCCSKTEDVNSSSFAETFQRGNSRGKVLPGRKAVMPNMYPSSSQLKRRTQLLTDDQFSKLNPRLLQAFVASVAVCCAVWTVGLMLLTIKPNSTVNWVMKTEHFDDGSFWLMVDPSETMIQLSVSGQAVTIAAYGFVLVKITRRRNRVNPGPQAILAQQLDALSTSFRREVVDEWLSRHESRVATFLASSLSLFRQEDSHAVRIARIWLKFADLAVETVFLHQILEAGTPVPLVIFFTAIVAMNACSCISMMFLPDDYSGLLEIVLDIGCDFMIVVVYPVAMLAYCFSCFGLDRTKIGINLEIFPVGWFEQNASVVADPEQTEIIYTALKSLQIFTWMDFILRVGVHLIFSFRLYRLADLVQNQRKRPARLYPKRHRLSTLLLALYTVFLVIYVEGSMRTSALACQPHPECAVKAHRWITVDEGSLTQCPCLTLIDGDVAPKSFEEWLNPVDATAKVVQLATTGDLRTIQLTNRYFPDLPGELRKCRHLRHLTLVYTHTTSMPSWTKEWMELEYLYIEGTMSSSLNKLPDEMFDSMASLTFVHLGGHTHLEQLPSFRGLINLKALALAMFVSLLELPAFDSLHKLERLVMSFLPSIETLPDLKPLRNLKAFSVNSRGSWCCNGFLNECNLTSSFCLAQEDWGVPAASCLPQNTKASSETTAIIKRFSATVCGEDPSKQPGPGYPTPENVAQCNGTLYRRCSLPGFHEAMCYNARFMAIFCTSSPLLIEMRRRQIELGVGDACNPEHEAWLGCK